MATMSPDGKKRCFGCKNGQENYANYHDNEWGVPSYDDRHLFEFLILEGAQAGLSWETVLNKRQGYKTTFHQFDPALVATMSDAELDEALKNPAIIRNRLKVYSARTNALVFLEIQKEYGSFSTYLWSFVNNKPVKNKWKSFSEIPSSTPLSDQISKDLKKRGMRFVGSTIIYAYLQAVGVVNDHLQGCWKY